MQNIPHSQFARAQADAMIAARFQEPYGISTLDEYLARIDRLSTAHLEPKVAKAVLRKAGSQRRKAQFSISEDGTLLIHIPMKDPRSGNTLWAFTEFHTWMNITEMGAKGTWFFNYKSTEKKAGQVRTHVPMKRSAGCLATITRVIANAKPGQQARLRDHNPLNLRHNNIAIIGNPTGPEGKAGHAKTDTRAAVRESDKLRAERAGADFDYTRRDDN